ncbi:50S ribosomal protein L22 [Patescibacteria group bacterium]|nr:50S ribosomal protein L22 [Patescibacteria group bacterium]
MLSVKAKLKNVRMAPRKVRVVADVIRGMDAVEALHRLFLLSRRSAGPISKLLKSAMANAEHNHNLKKENLYIKEITVNEGSILYRWMPRAFGRATPLRKRTSIVCLALSEKIDSEKLKEQPKGTEKIQTIQASGKASEKMGSKNVMQKKEPLEKGLTDEEKPQPFDVRSQGKHRHIQHQDQKNKKSKGILKKMFQRKAGM